MRVSSLKIGHKNKKFKMLHFSVINSFLELLRPTDKDTQVIDAMKNVKIQCHSSIDKLLQAQQKVENAQDLF